MNYLLAAGNNPLPHVLDHPRHQEGMFTLWSNHIIMLIAAGILVCLVMRLAVRRKRTGDEVDQLTPSGFGNAVEGICQFIRDFVARPNLGEHTDRFIPYLWTCFFFILSCNLLGLLPLEPLTKPFFDYPVYGTATANPLVTGTLAICTLLMIVVNGLRINGMDYVKHFFMGPFPINLLIAFLEVVGLIVKAAALMIRLAANMTAGHILLAVLLSFIGMAGKAGAGVGFFVAVPTVIGSVAINMLEIFVAFLQAFIFTFLSAVFIGQAVNIHHDDHHEEHDEGTAESVAHR